MRAKLKSRGFTLVELLMIVAILSVLVVIALPMFSTYKAKAANASALSDLKIIRTMLDAYSVDNQGYPNW
jgi:type IV pilus assembly protein PilA